MRPCGFSSPVTRIAPILPNGCRNTHSLEVSRRADLCDYGSALRPRVVKTARATCRGIHRSAWNFNHSRPERKSRCIMPSDPSRPTTQPAVLTPLELPGDILPHNVQSSLRIATSLSVAQCCFVFDFSEPSSIYPLSRSIRSRSKQKRPIADNSILPAFSTRVLGA